MNSKFFISAIISDDIARILAPGAGFLAFSLATDSGVVIHLRIDQIHAYAPVGQEMEIFYGAHVWRVREHFIALQTVMRGEWETIEACLRVGKEKDSVDTVRDLLQKLNDQLYARIPGAPKLPDHLGLAFDHAPA